jgi:hypothetical protein
MLLSLLIACAARRRCKTANLKSALPASLPPQLPARAPPVRGLQWHSRHTLMPQQVGAGWRAATYTAST